MEDFADFDHARTVLSKEQIEYIQSNSHYKIGETVVGFTPRNLDKLFVNYGQNASNIREYNNYHDSTLVMNEAQLIVKAQRATDMSQYGWTRILKHVLDDIQTANEINALVSNVTLVRKMNTDKREFVRYAKVIFVVPQDDALRLNNVINLVKDKLVRNVKLITFLGGNGVDSVCHFTTNKNAAYLYNYRIFGVNLNFNSCGIKNIASLMQIGIFFAINMPELVPQEWEFFAVFDSENQCFKGNQFELSTNVRIENLVGKQRVFVPTNYTINGLSCGLNLRISRLGTVQTASDPKLLVNNEKIRSEYQKKMNAICTHEPVIDAINKQAMDREKYHIAAPILINAMQRIFNYKVRINEKLCMITPQQTIEYAIKSKVWSQNGAIVQFDCCLKQINSRMEQDDSGDYDDDIDSQYTTNNNNNNDSQVRRNFGGPQNSLGRRTA